jgi:hypothetical protein
MRYFRSWIYLALAVLPQSAHSSSKKQPPPPSAPPEVVARVRAAHNIFVSNASVGVIIAAKAARVRDYYHYYPYKDMYYALSAWPGVKLVDTPAQADLVFQVLANEADYAGNERNISSTLTIIEPQTQTVLWQATLPLGSTVLGYTDGRFAKATSGLLSPFEPRQPAPAPLKVTVPMPAQLHAGSKVFVQPSSPSSQFQGIDVAQIAHDAFAKAKFYTLVDSPGSADLIVTASVSNNGLDEQQLLLEALDPQTSTVLWTQLCATASSGKPIEEQIRDTFPYALKYWESLATQSHVGN